MELHMLTKRKSDGCQKIFIFSHAENKKVFIAVFDATVFFFMFDTCKLLNM